MSDTNQRVDVVFIRKSSAGQDEDGQISNVKKMLTERHVEVPEDRWFIETVSRRKVNASPVFRQLLDTVKQDRIRTIYIEAQDRWGTKDRPEFFSILGILRQHDTQLIDLRENKDITLSDFTTELLAFIGSCKSEKELQDISYRSLRSRVSQFSQTGSWPTGTHPYGYAKACYSPEGKLKWEWHPCNRKLGQAFYGPNGESPGPENERIPRKGKHDVIRLVPNRNREYVRAVQLVFDLYSRVGLSRRQIAIRLNAQGIQFNGGTFSHTDITNILRNPAYVGDTIFGKVHSGELHTFDECGNVNRVVGDRENRLQDKSKCLIKKDTHEPLVSREAWQLTQERLAAELDRTSHSPRNPQYFLKQVLVCGHCGKSMSARTEIHPKTRARTVVYVCSSYLKGRTNGVSANCGYHRITHRDAEQLLLNKLTSLGLQYDESVCEPARNHLRLQLSRLYDAEDEMRDQWGGWLQAGVDAVEEYCQDTFGLDEPCLKTIRCATRNFYRLGGKESHHCKGKLPQCVADIRQTVKAAERTITEKAKKRLTELKEKHYKLTIANLTEATDKMRQVAKKEIERIESEIDQMESQLVPLSERFRQLHREEDRRLEERKRLRNEWKNIGDREKGEALRRIFRTVKLYWNKRFHPSEQVPSRPRKTSRLGRFSYTLQSDRIEWHRGILDSETFW